MTYSLGTLDTIISQKKLSKDDIVFARQILQQIMHGLSDKEVQANRVLSLKEELLKEADEKAKLIIENAKIEASKIVESAKMNAENLTNKAENVAFTQRRCLQIEREAKSRCEDLVTQAKDYLMKIFDDHLVVLEEFIKDIKQSKANVEQSVNVFEQ